MSGLTFCKQKLKVINFAVKSLCILLKEYLRKLEDNIRLNRSDTEVFCSLSQMNMFSYLNATALSSLFGPTNIDSICFI